MVSGRCKALCTSSRLLLPACNLNPKSSFACHSWIPLRVKHQEEVNLSVHSAATRLPHLRLPASLLMLPANGSNLSTTCPAGGWDALPKEPAGFEGEQDRPVKLWFALRLNDDGCRSAATLNALPNGEEVDPERGGVRRRDSISGALCICPFCPWWSESWIRIPHWQTKGFSVSNTCLTQRTRNSFAVCYHISQFEFVRSAQTPDARIQLRLSSTSYRQAGCSADVGTGRVGGVSCVPFAS